LRGCKCPDCTAANRRYITGYRGELQRAPVDLAVAQLHISRLRDQRLGLRQIAKQAGVTRYVVRRILQSKPGYRRSTTLTKLLAAQPVIAPRALVPALPTWRIVKWLESEGFSRPRIAALIGLAGGKPIILRKRYTMRVVARLRRLKRHYESQDSGIRSPFGTNEHPHG
jgi:hypothetical protein